MKKFNKYANDFVKGTTALLTMEYLAFNALIVGIINAIYYLIKKESPKDAFYKALDAFEKIFFDLEDEKS